MALYYFYYSILGYSKIIKSVFAEKKVGIGYVLLIFIVSIFSTYYLIKNSTILYDYYNLDDIF
tara:strand:- start:226 stop:414 length:189 start_codon:yes stop_codon:yes gene_type:complete